MLGSFIIFAFGIFFIILGTGVGIRYNTNPLPTIFMMLGLIICLCAIAPPINNDKPSALDVYQGKTTLEITYKDGVAIDSVVVYKNN